MLLLFYCLESIRFLCRQYVLFLWHMFPFIILSKRQMLSIFLNLYYRNFFFFKRRYVFTREVLANPLQMKTMLKTGPSRYICSAHNKYLVFCYQSSNRWAGSSIRNHSVGFFFSIFFFSGSCEIYFSRKCYWYLAWRQVAYNSPFHWESHNSLNINIKKKLYTELKNWTKKKNWLETCHLIWNS